MAFSKGTASKDTALTVLFGVVRYCSKETLTPAACPMSFRASVNGVPSGSEPDTEFSAGLNVMNGEARAVEGTNANAHIAIYIYSL